MRTERKRGFTELPLRAYTALSIMTLSDFLDVYFSSRVVSADYEALLRGRLKPWYSLDVTALDTDTVNRFLVMLARSGLSPYTVLAYRRNILAVLNAAADRDLCGYPNSRRVIRPKLHQLTPEGWTLEQVVALLHEARDPYWDAVIRVAWDTGLRRGDVLRVHRSQFTTEPIAYRQHKTKRAVLICCHESTMQSLAKLPGDTPLAWRRHRKLWFDAFRRIVTRAGLSGTFGHLRRSAGSIAESQTPGGGQRKLGHSSSRMFDAFYKVDRLANSVVIMPPELP